MIASIEGQNDFFASKLSLDRLWGEAKDSLSKVLPAASFTWITRLEPQFKPDGSLNLAAPNYFFRNFIEKAFGQEIRLAIAQKCRELGCPSLIDIQITESNNPSPDDNHDVGANPEGLTIPKGLAVDILSLNITQSPFNPKFTFENFVVGDPNSLAFHASKAFSVEQNLGTGILYLIGAPGLGKSHLAQALGQNYLNAKSTRLVKYLTFESFTNDMVHNLNQKTMEAFKRRYREECDLLMLEGASFLHNKFNIQQELCYTLDFLINKGKKIVMTSTEVPHNIPKMDRSLRSRLTSSLFAHIGPPDFKTRLGILNHLAKNCNHKFNQQVLDYVAQNVKEDVRQLESCIYTLDANHNLLKKPITLAMAEEVVDSVTGRDENKTGLYKVVKLICRIYNLDEEELRSKSRRRNINEARSLGMYLAKTLTGHTLSEIGEAFGRRHSTAIYSIHKLKKTLPTDHKLKVKFDYLLDQLGKEI
jgi:chromosomal replication initiator protein